MDDGEEWFSRHKRMIHSLQWKNRRILDGQSQAEKKLVLFMANFFVELYIS